MPLHLTPASTLLGESTPIGRCMATLARREDTVITRHRGGTIRLRTIPQSNQDTSTPFVIVPDLFEYPTDGRSIELCRLPHHTKPVLTSTNSQWNGRVAHRADAITIQTSQATMFSQLRPTLGQIDVG